MGEVLADLTKYMEALEQQKQYLAMSRQLQDAVMEQIALATLGRTYKDIAETDKDAYRRSLNYLTKCLQVSKKDIDTKERSSMTGRAEENLRVVSWHLGNVLVMVVRCRKQIMAGVGEGLMSHTAYVGLADSLSTVCLQFVGTGETVKVLEQAYSRSDNEGSMASLPTLNISIVETYKDMGNMTMPSSSSRSS